MMMLCERLRHDERQIGVSLGSRSVLVPSEMNALREPSFRGLAGVLGGEMGCLFS